MNERNEDVSERAYWQEPIQAASAPSAGSVPVAALNRLGARLAVMLDEDQFGTIEPFLNACNAPPANAPIDMVLYCSNCGTQHIDAPEEHETDRGLSTDLTVTWTNPPHRSHLCHACETIWRPADVATNGVAAINTKGKDDTWSLAANAQAPSVLTDEQIRHFRVMKSVVWPDVIAIAEALGSKGGA